MSQGFFVWHELNTTDIPRARAFYSELVGWKFEEMDMGPSGKYTVIKAGDRAIGGLLTTPQGVPPHFLPYVEVGNVDTAVAEAKKLGGKALMEPMDVPTVGRFAPIQDPQGGVLALIKSTTPMTLPERAPAGAFAWNEVLALDPSGLQTFYTKVVGWTAKTVPMGPTEYTLFMAGDKDVSGMMKTPVPGAPAHWLAYIRVTDVDGTAKRADALGGKVMMPGTDIPNVGRFAVIVDPMGAAVALFKPAA